MENILRQATDGLKNYEYHIEYGTMDAYDTSPALEKVMHDLYARVNKKQKNTSALIADIKKSIAKYPDALPLKNYLYCAYMEAGDYKNAKEVNDKLLWDYPGYLFAILNKAAMHLMDEEFEKVPEVFGPMLELGELFPERKTFHVTEVAGFNKMVVLYACGTGNLELAENRLKLMQDIAPDSPDTEFSWKAVMGLRMKGVLKIMEQSQMRRIEYNEVAEDYLSMGQSDAAPFFYHAEVQQLYRFSFEIDVTVFRQILALPRETLIKDLQEVIKDSIRRCSFFEEGDFTDNETYAVIHATALLAELKATEARPALLEILRQGQNYYDFWFGDMITESLWQVYYALFDANDYLDYLKEPHNYTFAKAVITEAIQQKTLHGELPKTEATEIYRQLLCYFIDNHDNADLIDHNFIGGTINDICQLQITALLPEVKQCFDLDIVDQWVCGKYESIEKNIRTSTPWRKRENTLATGFENFYAKLAEVYSREEDDDDDDDYFDDEHGPGFLDGLHESETLQLAEALLTAKPLAGRNDPCPCGSGKKYKKCCL